MFLGIYSDPNYIMHHGVKGMQWGVRKDKGPVPTGTRHALDRRLRNYIGKKTGHYGRNDKNVNLPQNAREAKKMGWEKSSKAASSAHQFYRKDGVANQKWMSPDGHREVIFSGRGNNQRINSHQEDFGTYNKYNYKTNPIGHTVVDVLPYIALGNGAEDNTTMLQRVGTMSTNAIKNGAKKLKTMGVR